MNSIWIYRNWFSLDCVLELNDRELNTDPILSGNTKSSRRFVQISHGISRASNAISDHHTDSVFAASDSAATAAAIARCAAVTTSAAVGATTTAAEYLGDDVVGAVAEKLGDTER